jgi:chaperonin GroEL
MNKQGYIPKDLHFDSEGRSKLMLGIEKISSAVKSTLGPRGKTVIIESTDHLRGLTVTKDGVTVARSIFLDDPVENLAIQIMKEAANRTANSAGDGTTTAIVLAEAFVKAGSKYIIPSNNTSMVVRHVQSIIKDVVKHLEKESKKITDTSLLDVAKISANNDSEIGQLIFDAYQKVGKDGIVTVERSQNHETYAEVTNGIKIDRGYSSNLFINNQKKDECILENVKVLVCDQDINNVLQIESVLKPIIQNNETLLIIADCGMNVINTLAANVARNGLKICNIPTPSFGYKKHELMQDIALTLGANYLSEKTGDDLTTLNESDLGHADKIIVGKTNSVVITNAQPSEELLKRIAELKIQRETTEVPIERKFIDERIASLAGAIGCIHVGGNSDVEQKEKFDRVDDSVCAVRSALEEGIVAGGGVALYNASKKIKNKNNDADYNTAFNIVQEAICQPLIQILKNAGINPDNIIDELNKSSKKNYGFDVKNEKFGDLFKLGVIDPLKVAKNALINSSSVATTILSTNAIITHARVGRKEETNNN